MPEREYWDAYLGADLGVVDPDIDAIIDFEEERQARKLIMIPSESMAPLAVRQALGSVFNNVYAEGYPPLRMTRDDEDLLLDYPHQLAYYRRYADRRFYKGVDYVHFVETLAQRRAALIFANDRVSDKNIYVNVQPLSGAAANLAVYDAFLQTGDTVMGMDLFQGGHLTHGSEFNFSGKRFRVASYGVSKATGKLDYDEIRDLARRNRPKMIIAGFTSYTWAPDWQLFAEIAHEVGAILLADISHPAGMATAGAYPNPVGIADVVTCTTHKTLCGPRGAIIMTTDEDLSKRIDMAVFPGEQGGPHTQKFAAMAVAFKIAATAEFKRMMHRIKENAAALAERADQARAQAGLRRHRHPLLHARPQQREVEDGPPLARRAGRPHPRPGGHRRQQEHDPRRHAHRGRHGHPPRHALAHAARVRPRRDRPGRGADPPDRDQHPAVQLHRALGRTAPREDRPGRLRGDQARGRRARRQRRGRDAEPGTHSTRTTTPCPRRTAIPPNSRWARRRRRSCGPRRKARRCWTCGAAACCSSRATARKPA